MKLLITGAWHDAEQYIPLLRERGHEILFMQNETDELPCAPDWVQGVVCNGLFVSHDIRRFTSLRYVQLTSAGLDRIPADELRQKGVTVRSARGVYSIPMAEHAVAAVLNFYRNSRFFYENQQKQLWQKDRSLRELCGSRICVIGCGSVGSECAKRFSAFGCEVIGIDIHSGRQDGYQYIAPIGDLLSEVSTADVVILSLPLTKDTEGIADESFFAALREGCILVNIARGKIIRTDAMIKALGSRRLFAALDVFDEEPLAGDSPLWKLTNVQITPHNSFVSDKNGERLNRLILSGLE